MTQTSVCRGVHTASAIYRGTMVAKRVGKTVTLNTGGWWTATTELRMNQFANQFCQSRFGVHQKDGNWFVRVGSDWQGETVRYLPFDDSTITFDLE